MHESLTENAQWDSIKNWLRQHGVRMAVIGIVLLTITFGWRYWQDKLRQNKEEASQLFDQLLTVDAVNPLSPMVTRITDAITKDYANTVYAPLALLFAAKSAIFQNQLYLAETKLKAALEKTHGDNLKMIIQIRLIRVLLAENKEDEALKLLDIPRKSVFSPEIARLKSNIKAAHHLETKKPSLSTLNASTHVPTNTVPTDTP